MIDGREQKTERIVNFPDVRKYERAGFYFVSYCPIQTWEKCSNTRYDPKTQRFGDTQYYWEDGCVWRRGENQ